MPSPIAHTIIGSSVFLFFQKEVKLAKRIEKIIYYIYIILLSNIYDFDFFRLTNEGLKINLSNHTREGHSIFITLIILICIYLLYKIFRIQKPVLSFIKYSLAALLSHLFLDLLCYDMNYTNGIGMPVFYPFSYYMVNIKIYLFTGLNIRNIISFYNFSIIFYEFIITGLIFVLCFKIQKKRNEKKNNFYSTADSIN